MTGPIPPGTPPVEAGLANNSGGSHLACGRFSLAHALTSLRGIVYVVPAQPCPSGEFSKKVTPGAVGPSLNPIHLGPENRIFITFCPNHSAKPGETVVVAAASGAVGSVVGQIAKIKGCHAVGIAGGTEKCRFVTGELGFDACVDHRAPDFAKLLEAACPEGIDVYFENVGGVVQQTVWPLLNDFARVPVCGLIAQYNATTPMPGPDMFSVLRKRLLVRGFIVSDFASKQADFLRDVGEWVRTGRLKYREDIVDGLEKAPTSFIGMLQGKNFGKTLVRIAI